MDFRYPRQGVARFALGLAAVVGLSIVGAAAADEPGTWQSHELMFDYLGVTPTYSCEGLQDTLTALLKESGARPDISVAPGPCARGFGTPERIAYARLKFSTLMPATSASQTASGDQVNGAWHHVVIGVHDAVLQGGNCELVQEFKGKVLPLFVTRNAKADLPCISYQDTGYFFSLSFDVFAPGDASLLKSPATPIGT